MSVFLLAFHIDLGSIKILELNDDGTAKERTSIPDEFDRLGDNYCSLGQAEDYYRFLSAHKELGASILRSLKDIVYDSAIYVKFKDINGFDLSLVRFSEAARVLNEAPALFGRARSVSQSSWQFYMDETIDDSQFLPLDFSEHGGLPHRVIALIGRNGSGKTHTLSQLALAASGMENIGRFLPSRPLFSKVIAVSYNAFDLLKTPDELNMKGDDIAWDHFSYKYCGLRHEDIILSGEQLFEKLDESYENIIRKTRIDIVRQGIEKIIPQGQVESFLVSKDARKVLYDNMSAGQKIILSILFDVIAFIEENSLLVFDEPENHLHPGLLSSLVSIVYEILDKFKSYSIIATHSPIVIQQLPARFVLRVKRDGDVTTFHRPIGETFGEDLSTLTEDLLGLAEPETDYHDVLDRLMIDKSYEQILQLFEGRLPLSARLYLRSCLGDA